MSRLMLKTLLSLLAAALLDRYGARRARRGQAERAADLSRWEGEGGTLSPARETPPG